MIVLLYFLGLVWIFSYFTEGITKVRVLYATSIIWGILFLYEVIDLSSPLQIVLNVTNSILWGYVAIKEHEELRDYLKQWRS